MTRLSPTASGNSQHGSSYWDELERDAKAASLILPLTAHAPIIRAARRWMERAADRSMTKDMSDEEQAEFIAELERLREEHRDLDAAIEALTAVGAYDRLQLQRLKKRKLALRDRISFLEDALTPDIIA
ncbi:hypothetical protein M2321_002383 [Rhodoblastus acidophilus]|jgi:hypothetical protein|nr:hypothetical protein [Rhodoblastus acidophilus]